MIDFSGLDPAQRQQLGRFYDFVLNFGEQKEAAAAQQQATAAPEPPRPAVGAPTPRTEERKTNDHRRRN